MVIAGYKRPGESKPHCCSNLLKLGIAMPRWNTRYPPNPRSLITHCIQSECLHIDPFLHGLLVCRIYTHTEAHLLVVLKVDTLTPGTHLLFLLVEELNKLARVKSAT